MMSRGQGPECNKCGEVHERCDGHRPRDKRPCGMHPMRGQDLCRRCAGPPSARKKARERVAEAEAKEMIRGLGRPEPHNLTEGVLEEIFWLKGSIIFIKTQIEELDPDAVIWGITEHTDKTGGEDWGIKTTEKAVVNVWVKLLQEQQKLYLEFVSKAHSMGIEERRIQLADRYVDYLLKFADVYGQQLRETLVSFGWDGDELEEVWADVVQRVLPSTLGTLKELVDAR